MALTFQRGQIWRVRVPYNDDPQTLKYRPVVVIGWSKFGADQDNVVLVVPVTSFGDGGGPKQGDVEIREQQLGGLSRSPSWARARRVWGADPKAFDRARGCTGEVTPAVMALILTEIEKLFAA